MCGVADGDGSRNENSGAVGGNFVQIGTMRGNLTQQHVPADESLAGDLAGVVREQSQKEEEHRRIGDPAPLSVRWHTAAKDLVDYWENIHGSSGGHDPVPLAGQFAGIRETFTDTDSQRLVVLGRAGAGKTVLAHRLILDLLEHRDHRGPVPVLFPLNSWNATTTALRDWVVDRLARDHPFLEPRDSTGKRKAEVLVDGGWILPVLDGFDEIPDQHHSDAIIGISNARWPLVVTSRPKEYAQAARTVKAVGKAAAIEIEDLDLDHTERYLCRSTNPTRAADWQAVFQHLRTAPDDPASRNLTSVLATPLMVMLARTTYNDNNERSPSELLDTARFPDSDDLRKQLLSGYMDTVYDPRRTTSGPTWDSERARHWLGHLATSLEKRNTHDLTWWQLPATLARPTRILTTNATYALALGITGALVIGIASGTFGIATGFLAGLTAGLAVGLINEVGFSRGRTGREPERLRPYWRRRGRQRRRSKRRSLVRSASELSNGLVIGLVIGIQLTFALNGIEHVLNGLGLGLALGAVFGLVNVGMSALGDSRDPHGSDPWELLTTDRTVTLTRTITTTLVTITTVLWGWPLAKFNPTLVGAIMFGLLAGIARLAFSAWGSWLLFARLWLPLTGRLPWRPKRFFQDAYERGVLRQAGTTYQFRHAQLRDHLADHHPRGGKTAPPPSDPAPAADPTVTA